MDKGPGQWPRKTKSESCLPKRQAGILTVFLSPKNGSKSIPTKLTSSDMNFWTPWRRPTAKKKCQTKKCHLALTFAICKDHCHYKMVEKPGTGIQDEGWRNGTWHSLLGQHYRLPFLTMTVYRYTLDNYLKKRLYKKDWPVQCDLAPCTLPHHLMLQRRVGRSGPCTQHQQYPYYQIPRGKQTHCNNIVYSHLSVALLRIKKHELMKIGLFTVS